MTAGGAALAYEQQFPRQDAPLTLLVLDSGVGGLTIYQQIQHTLPALRHIYAFDNEGFPYGERPAAQVTQRVAGLIEIIHKRHGLCLAVVACNTASTIALPLLRAKFPFPVVGVVPAIKPAVTVTRSGIIGLLASKATIQRDYIDDLIKQFATQCRVERLGSTELVRLAEAKLRGEMVSHQQIAHILAPWLSNRIHNTPDTIVLGCTHFPLLRHELSAVLPPGVILVDSAVAVARQVEKQLSSICGNQHPSLMNTGSDVDDLVNLAYCTRLDVQAQALQPVLQHYRLMSLQVLALTDHEPYWYK